MHPHGAEATCGEPDEIKKPTHIRFPILPFFLAFRVPCCAACVRRVLRLHHTDADLGRVVRHGAGRHGQGKALPPPTANRRRTAAPPRCCHTSMLPPPPPTTAAANCRRRQPPRPIHRRCQPPPPPTAAALPHRHSVAVAAGPPVCTRNFPQTSTPCPPPRLPHAPGMQTAMLR